MSRWEQIYRHFPLHAWLIGWLYVYWLRLCRWLGYSMGASRREWCTASETAIRARIVE
jgi:hypothetical protein